MYTLIISADARSDLLRLHPAIRTRVQSKLTQLQETCDDRLHKALQGIHKGKFSLRVAKDYRIIYSFNRQTREITIFRIGHHSKIY